MERQHSDSVSTPPPPPKRKYSDYHDAELEVIPASIDAQKALIARTAPHLFEPSPSAPPSGPSSPSSDEERSPLNLSHHPVPKGFRGPIPRIGDAESLAPRPHLVPTPGSSTLFNTTNFVINRNGWRYNTAGPSSAQLPTTVYKTLETEPERIHWCWSDRSAFTKISAEADVVSTDKGFRSARTNVGVRAGTWYLEIEIMTPEVGVVGAGSQGPMPLPMRDGPHVRVGWGRREAQLNAPVGFDGYSYAYRDKTGDKVTFSRPQAYGNPFKAGDVVGLLISLPPEREAKDPWDPAKITRERIPIRYRSQLYFEALEYPKSREMDQLMDKSRKALLVVEDDGKITSDQPADTAVPAGSSTAKVKNRKIPGKPPAPTKAQLRPIPRLEGSKIEFFLNGESQGPAFTNLFDYRPLRVRGADAPPLKGGVKDIPGVRSRENIFDDGMLGYFPFVSVYGGARAKIITGQEGFRFPLPQGARPLCERYAEHLSEQWRYDLQDEAQAAAKKRECSPLTPGPLEDFCTPPPIQEEESIEYEMQT